MWGSDSNRFTENTVTLVPTEGFLDVSNGAFGVVWSRRTLERWLTAVNKSKFCCGRKMHSVQRIARQGVEGREKKVVWRDGNKL